MDLTGFAWHDKCEIFAESSFFFPLQRGTTRDVISDIRTAEKTIVFVCVDHKSAIAANPSVAVAI